jgi:hypothetical protein
MQIYLNELSLSSSFGIQFSGKLKKTFMKQTEKEEEFKKTQSTSSPGALGEDVNRTKKKSSDPIEKENERSSKSEGLNEERSAGNAGAFEGLENTGDS